MNAMIAFEDIQNDSQSTYPSNQIQTEMALDIPPEVFRQTLNQTLFINSSCFQPFVLIIAANSLSKLLWKQPMMHPLLGVTPFYSHLLQPDRKRLKIGL